MPFIDATKKKTTKLPAQFDYGVGGKGEDVRNAPYYESYYKKIQSGGGGGESVSSKIRAGKILRGVNETAKKKKAPTTLSDENIRVNVIPELQAEVGKLSEPDMTPVPPMTPEGQPMETPTGKKEEEKSDYEKALDLYNQYTQDPKKTEQTEAIDRDIATIESLANQGRKDSLQARRAIASQYNVRRDQVNQLYANLAKTTQNALMLSGGARYAPISSQGILSMQEQKHIFSLSQLDAEELQLEQEVKKTAKDNNWKLTEEKLGFLKEKRDAISKREEELRKATEEKNKEINDQLERSTRDTAIAGLIQQGVTDPAQILDALNFDNEGKAIGDFTAEEVGDTVKFLKENSTDDTLKDTLDIYSKKLDIEKKMKDLESAPEMSASTLSKVQTIAQSYDGNQIVKDFSAVQNKEASVKRIIDSGVGGPADLALVFEFMKALDPTSVVREAEYDSAAKSGNIFSGIFAKFNGYLKPEGGFLPDEVKSGFDTLIEAKLDVAKQQYKNYRQEQARKINKITGKTDGIDYLTSYDIDFTTQTYSTLEEYYDNADEDEQTRVETLINDNPNMSNEEILQILNASDDTGSDEMAIMIPPESNLAYSNNNPGNLRYVGQKGAVPGEGGFAYFPSPYEGYKALERQMGLDADRGLTLRQLIEKYAPPSENDTELYISQMVDQLGVPETTKISTLHTGKLARAIMWKESSAVIG